MKHTYQYLYKNKLKYIWFESFFGTFILSTHKTQTIKGILYLISTETDLIRITVILSIFWFNWIYHFNSKYQYIKLNELTPEDLSGETNKRVSYNAKQINENVKIDELNIIEVDKLLKDLKRVFFQY